MIFSCRRVLVIAPHPDDEAIAAWALMRRATRRGARVDVVVVSDGSASHPNSRRWPRERLVPERQREVRRVLRAIGIGRAQIACLGLPDGALPNHQHDLRRILARTIAARRPNLVVSPVPHDAHADHRAVAAALALVPRRGELRLGYGVWPQGVSRALRDLVLPLTPGEVQQKRAAIRRYRTQTGLITDAQAGFTMTYRHLKAFAGPSERFAKL